MSVNSLKTCSIGAAIWFETVTVAIEASCCWPAWLLHCQFLCQDSQVEFTVKKRKSEDVWGIIPTEPKISAGRLDDLDQTRKTRRLLRQGAAQGP
jgi:hypothetical protein